MPFARRRSAAAGAAVAARDRERFLRAREPFPCLDAAWLDASTRRYDRTHPAFALLSGYRRYWIDCDFPPAPLARYREATRQWLGDCWSAGAPAWLLDSILREMHRRDRLLGYGMATP